MQKIDHSSMRKIMTYQHKSGYHPRDIKTSLRRIIIFSMIAAVLLAAIGFWTHHAIKLSLEESYTTYLQTLLDADITALTIWMENEKRHVRSWADEPNLREHVRVLVKMGRNAPLAADKLMTSQALVELQDALKSVVKDKDYQGFAIVDRSGFILASTKESPYLGKNISSEFMQILEQVFQGKVIMERPHLQANLIPNLKARLNQPVMLTAAPVSDETGTVLAALLFTINPDQDFTRILSVARAGASGDTYAFDGNGFLISDSRFEDQLKAVGIIADTPEARSILSVQIRDPGGNLTKGFALPKSLTNRPLTRMAKAAVAGETGADLKGYRDYRGVEVFGAWKWLADYGFGVATEISKTEALAILDPLKRIFWGLFILLVASVAMIVSGSFLVQRLRKRIEQVRNLGQYTLEEKIGEGGMGEVYKATHAILKRPTAVKILKPEAVNPETIARFEREVQLTSQLTHPNTVEVYDYGHTSEGIFYYAMEYLPGLNLAQLIEMEGNLPSGRVIHILKHICFSLEEAHAISLIHRDIKPLNVILCERGGQFDAVKVLDFGLVKDIGGQDTVHTAAHELTGTPAYVAPERLTDPQNIDTRSDIYSVGSVGFNLLTGQDVFEGANAMEIGYHVMKTPAPRVSEKISLEIPAKLDRLINDCLAKDPVARPQNVREIIEILNSIEDVGRWEQKDAKRWWDTHAARIQDINENSRLS
jgi:tRNA A-37 threonylcarbamoyl transferase component Bud32